VTGKFLIRCPKMTILATMKPWVRECQELVCPNNEIVLDDGTKVSWPYFPSNLSRSLLRAARINVLTEPIGVC